MIAREWLFILDEQEYNIFLLIIVFLCLQNEYALRRL